MSVLDTLRQLKLVPVIVIDDPDSAPALGRALVEGGLPCDISHKGSARSSRPSDV
jgi:2-keto-3-deoxy-6-phosphogluconate aldolase